MPTPYDALGDALRRVETVEHRQTIRTIRYVALVVIAALLAVFAGIQIARQSSTISRLADNQTVDACRSAVAADDSAAADAVLLVIAHGLASTDPATVAQARRDLPAAARLLEATQAARRNVDQLCPPKETP